MTTTFMTLTTISKIKPSIMTISIMPISMTVTKQLSKCAVGQYAERRYVECRGDELWQFRSG
jgi:hypothetical protein